MTRLLRALALLATIALAGCASPPSGQRIDPVAVGLRRDTYSGLDVALRESSHRWRVPGVELAIGRDGRLVYEGAAGWADLSPDHEVRTAPDTRFDVASLTKPLTAAAVCALVCDGVIAADETLAAGAPLDDVLRHASGMPEYVDWHTVAELRLPGERAADAAVKVALNQASLDQSRHQYRYSNVGYIALGALVESRTQRSLGEFLTDRLFAPLGMTHTGYRPARGPDAAIARTSLDVEPGEPFDPLAAWLLQADPGHDPGHAGVFSTAGDLALFGQALLHPDDSPVAGMRCIADRLMNDPVLLEVWQEPDSARDATPPIVRTRGFDATTEVPRGISLQHTGYTGCLLWVHRESGLSVALLTNATHGDRSDWRGLSNEVLRVLENSDLRRRAK